MKITYSNQTVDLFDEKHFPTGAPKKIVLSLSGGCDSASLAFLIATYFPQTEIHPFNCKDGDGLIDTERAISVHKYLQGRFSNIKELELFDVRTGDPVWIEKAEKEMADPRNKIMVNGKLTTLWRNVRGCSKALQCRAIRELMATKYNTIVATGMSCNPPIEVMKERGFYDVAERKRDPGDFESLDVFDKGYNNCITYTPYIFTNKKFVSGVYKEHNLIKDLFPLTKSCAWGVESGNENFPNPCGKCFWCNERAWAFQ